MHSSAVQSERLLAVGRAGGNGQHPTPTCAPPVSSESGTATAWKSERPAHNSRGAARACAVGVVCAVDTTSSKALHSGEVEIQTSFKFCVPEESWNVPPISRTLSDGRRTACVEGKHTRAP